MNLPKIISYEVKTSRTEQKVPVVNGVHLHSIFNPFREAESLTLTQLENLKNKKEVLILGLGFAYHVNSIAEKMASIHGDDFRIIVIEPNQQVYQDCLEFDLLIRKKVLVYPGHSSKELYSDLDFIRFLLRKPTVIAHPPSFNLYQNYFKDILTFEAPQKVGDVLEYISSYEIKNYLKTFRQDATFEEVIYQDIPEKTKFNEIDFLAMALIEMTKNSHEKKPLSPGEV